MIRRFTNCMVLLSSLLLLLNGCKDEEALAPPKTSFSSDKTSGEVNTTEFTFTVNQVNANSISLLPYGTDHPSWGGILVSGFTDGVATVKFTYSQVGTFQAVVVTNNHTGDGHVKNTYSDPITITINSNKNSLSDVSFDKATKTDVSGNTFTVTMPWGTDVTQLKAIFKSSPFSTVTVGGAAQTSGSTVNSFATPKTYTVTANDGTAANYTIAVVVTPAETDNTVKAASGKEVSKNRSNKVISASVDNTAKKIVLYDVNGTTADAFDSVRFNYTLTSKFAIAKYNGKLLKQDSLLDLTSSKQIVVYAQDSTTQTYTIFAAAAPKMTISFGALNPVVNATTTDFAIAANVLKGTDVTTLVPTTTLTLGSGVTVSSITANGNPFISGVTAVDFTKPVPFVLTVNDPTAGTYKVTYTATVTVVP